MRMSGFNYWQRISDRFSCSTSVGLGCERVGEAVLRDQGEGAPFNGNIIQSNIILSNLIMTSLKRDNPHNYPSTIIIDSQDQPSVHKASQKKIKTHSAITTNASPYQAIPQIPHIQLTVQQMNSDPLALIRQLETAYGQYGAVKLTVSQAWNCPYTFGNADRSLTVRVQTLQDLKQGKPFEQRVQSLRLPEFKKNANAFSNNYKFKTSPLGSTPESKRQHEYWNLVSKSEYEDDEVEVEYAADLPSSQYGSGFPTRKIHNWLDADFIYEDNLFNLNNIHKSPNSLLQVVAAKKDRISGITQPWMYAGMQFASFCWHVEDLFIHSINYNHEGNTKTWYVIPGSYKEQFDHYVEVHYESNRKKNLLQKIILMVDPLQLIKAGIPVYKVNQRPRDYIVTFLKAYHCGFSHGYNVCEAVNFAHYDDIDVIKESLKFYEEQETKQNRKLKSHVLSYEWAIYETIEHSLLPQSHPSREKILKEYKRIINREYLLIKGTLDKYGPFEEVKVIRYHKHYYANMCSHCKNYLYLTSLQCSQCKKNLCPRHLEQCVCETKKWNLYVRQLNIDRLALKKLVPLIDVHDVDKKDRKC